MTNMTKAQLTDKANVLEKDLNTALIDLKYQRLLCEAMENRIAKIGILVGSWVETGYGLNQADKVRFAELVFEMMYSELREEIEV